MAAARLLVAPGALLAAAVTLFRLTLNAGAPSVAILLVAFEARAPARTGRHLALCTNTLPRAALLGALKALTTASTFLAQALNTGTSPIASRFSALPTDTSPSTR